MSEEQTPQEGKIGRANKEYGIGEDKYKVINVVNGLIKENSSLRKQVEALTAKPNGEDQK